MPLVPTHKYRNVLALLVVVTAAGAAAAAFQRRADADSAAAADAVAGLYSSQSGGFRYEYHAPTGTEGLYDLRARREPPLDVLADHPEVAERCRSALRAKLGVDDLEVLRAAHADTIRRLKALGYL